MESHPCAQNAQGWGTLGPKIATQNESAARGELPDALCRTGGRWGASTPHGLHFVTLATSSSRSREDSDRASVPHPTLCCQLIFLNCLLRVRLCI